MSLSLSLLMACGPEGVDEEVARAESSLTALRGDTTEDPTTGDTHAHDEDDDLCTNSNVAPATLSAAVTVQESSITITASNMSDEPRWVRVTLHALLGETAPSAIRDAVVVPAGGTITTQVDARELGVEVSRLWLPVSLKAEVEVLDATGQPTERVFARGSLGAPLPEGALESAALSVDLGATTVRGQRGAAEFLAVLPGGAGRDLIPTGDPALADGARADAATGTGGLPEPPLGVQSGIQNYRFCFRLPVSLADAGFGEDYGVDPTNPWVARGMLVRGFAPGGVKKFDGYLDGQGCTTEFSSGDDSGFVIFGYTRAQIANNDLVVYNDNKLLGAVAIWGANPGPSGTKVYTFPDHELSNLLAVSAWTLARFNGGLSGETFKVNAACRPDGSQCCNCSSGGELWVTSDDRKFIIGHELGHRILGFYTGGYDNDCSFDLFVNPLSPMACDAGPGPGGHSMWSAEFESCAAMEGWAHFVATAAFNDTTEQDATMQYWGGSDPTINVENGPNGGQTAYYDTICNIATPSTLGVELDWLRQWWDYRTNTNVGDAGVRPSNGQMMDEISASLPWTNQTTWTNLTQGIEDTSGADQSQRWTDMGTWNGID